MADVKWGEREFVDAVTRANFDLVECQFEWELAVAGEGRCKQAIEPNAQARRARDRQRTRSPGDELCIKHEKRYATEMIEMEMANKNGIDCVAVRQLLHGDERRRPAINQEISSALSM